MRKEVSSNNIKSISQSSSVSQTSSYHSPKHFERKPKKQQKLEKFKMNCSKENLSYISPKRPKLSRQILRQIINRNEQQIKAQQFCQQKDLRLIRMKNNQLTNGVMKYNSTLTKQAKEQISKSYSYHSFNNNENQCINIKQNDKAKLNDLQLRIATLQRQNMRMAQQNEKNRKIAILTLQQNQRLKKMNDIKQQEIADLVTKKHKLEQQLQSFKQQNSKNQEKINRLNDKMKRITVRPILKRLQSQNLCIGISEQTQFLQQTINKLREQLFQSNKKIKYQQVEIITLKRKNLQIQPKKKIINLLLYEKAKLERKFQLISKMHKKSKNESKYIESKDNQIIIQLSPQKQQ